MTGDQITIYAEPSFVTYEITVKDQAAATMYTLGNLSTSDGQWATFIYVGGWRLFRSSGAGGVKHHKQAFTSNGTFTVPANVFRLAVEGCGGGGGGTAGSTGTTTTNQYGAGGGGGGGSVFGLTYVDVTPGASVTVTVGAGGSAGFDGADTTFGALATFPGAGKSPASGTYSNSAVYHYTAGGLPVRDPASRTQLFESATAILTDNRPPGSGGHGLNNIAFGEPGYVNAFGGFAAGTAGGASTGVDSSTYRGGGNGGGGGAGPYGAGGAGGVGGDGNNAGTGVAGGNGTAGAANTGAGGGGGGAGGRGSAAGGAAGTGGAGGSGKLIVTWVK